MANVPPRWQFLPEVGYDVEEPENGLQSISQLLFIVGGENAICLFLTQEPTHPRGIYSVSIAAPYTELSPSLPRSIGMGDNVRQLVNPQLLPIATAEVVCERVLVERDATDLRQLLRELLVEQIHDEVLHECFHVPIENVLKPVDVTEHQAAFSKESFHDVGAVSSLVHGILLDQPVRVAVDACVRKVLMVGCGLGSLCVTFCAK